MKTQSFKDLIVWQKSYELVLETYKMTSVFPKPEIYGLSQQMRRAAVSIPSNVAEGYGRKHTTSEAQPSSGSKEGKYALNWTRLSCHDFADNQVRLQLCALAYNSGNFLRRLALPKSVKQWSLRTLRDKLIKIGAKVVSHSRYVIFQMAEVVVPRTLFREILERIGRLRASPGLGGAG